MMYADANTWNAPIRPSSRLKKITGDSIGRVTARNRWNAPAPSISAASYSSFGICFSPARKITIVAPNCHTASRIIAGSTSSRVPDPPAQIDPEEAQRVVDRAVVGEHRPPHDRDRHRRADQRRGVERGPEEPGAPIPEVQQHRHPQRRGERDRGAHQHIDQRDLRGLDEVRVIREQADVVVQPDPRRIGEDVVPGEGEVQRIPHRDQRQTRRTRSATAPGTRTRSASPDARACFSPGRPESSARRLRSRLLREDSSPVTITLVAVVLTSVSWSLVWRFGAGGPGVAARAPGWSYWLRMTSISVKNSLTASSTVMVPKLSSVPIWRNFSSSVP